MSTTLVVELAVQTAARLRRRAAAEGTTPEAVVAAELDRPPRKSDTDPLMKSAGMFRSGVPDAAEPPRETRWAARPDKDWSLVDCASFIVLETRGLAEARTADRHFDQAGYVRLLK